MDNSVLRKQALILCTGNSCRSQMASGWINTLLADRWEAHSAGSHPAERVHPLAVRAMAEVGIDISGNAPRSMMDFVSRSFDVVATVCDSANEVCPVFPGPVQRIHHAFTDPALASGSEDEQMRVFRQVRDDICRWVTKEF